MRLSSHNAIDETLFKCLSENVTSRSKLDGIRIGGVFVSCENFTKIVAPGFSLSFDDPSTCILVTITLCSTEKKSIRHLQIV